MANKIIFGADLIDVLENKYNMNQLANVPTKYKNGVTTIDFIYGKEKDIDDLKYDKPYVEFSIDDETDGFISGTMYLNGGVEGIQFDSWEDLKYFMKNAKWTESKKYVRKSLKEEIYDIGDYTYPKIVTADNVDKILKSVKDGILDGYRFNCENIDISDLIYSNSFQKYFLNGGKIEWGKVKKSPFNGELVVLGKLIGNNYYDINIALESKENPFGYSKISHFNFFKKFDWIESKKSTRKSIKESKVDFQSVIDKVIPKEYAKNKNAYKYALSCVESLYNEDEYDSDSAKVYFLNCYISDSFPSWVDELGEEEMDALANALYDGTMKWSDIDSSWLESKKSVKKSLKESVDGYIATDEDCNMSGKGWVLDGSYNFIMEFLQEWGIAPKDVKVKNGMTTLYNADGNPFGYVYQDEEVDIFVADKTTNWTWENHNPSTKRVKVTALDKIF